MCSSSDLKAGRANFTPIQPSWESWFGDMKKCSKFELQTTSTGRYVIKRDYRWINTNSISSNYNWQNFDHLMWYHMMISFMYIDISCMIIWESYNNSALNGLRAWCLWILCAFEWSSSIYSMGIGSMKWETLSDNGDDDKNNEATEFDSTSLSRT